MMNLILSTFMAFAEPSDKGYYNETEISKASTLFAEAAKVSAPQFAQAEANIREHAGIIKRAPQLFATSQTSEPP